MKMKSFKISGWRSFDSNGVSVDGLKRVNLFIGQNNTGKSNISKFFMSIRMAAENSSNGNGKYHKINHVQDKSNTWGWAGGDICAEVTLDKDDTATLPNVHFKVGDVDIGLGVLFSGNEYMLSVKINGTNLLDPDSKNSSLRIYDFSEEEYTDLTEDVPGYSDTPKYWDTLLDSLVFVDPVRHFQRGSENRLAYYFDGANILTEIDKISKTDSSRPVWLQFKKKMKSWLENILNEDIEQIEFADGELRLQLNRGETPILAKLSELGTGVSQVVMLLSHLYLNKDKVLNVFLEEPESNLHPEALIKLIKIINDDLGRHNFFITTHSSCLIDQAKDDWSIYQVSRKLAEPSKISPCTTFLRKYNLLDDLGVRPSQLLQANLIIWVEGPSDRIYINKWIHEFSGGEYQEGLHFSYVYYGGSNLSGFSLLGDEEIDDRVDIFKTSRYVAIVCDSDCSSESDWNSGEFKSRVDHIKQKIKSLGEVDGGGARHVDDYVMLWITNGREIENYIPDNLFRGALLDGEHARKRIKNKDKNYVDLAIDQSMVASLNFGRFDSFDEVYAKCYKIANPKSEPVANLTEKIAASFSQKKVAISKNISQKWSKDNVIYDLAERMNEIIALIERANSVKKN